MATWTAVATVAANGRTTVSLSNGGALGGGVATLLVDDTKSRDQVDKAIRAIERAYNRRISRVVKVNALPTSGSSVE